MGTVIRLHARTPVLRGSRAAGTCRVIPYTRRFFASSSTKNQLAAGIEPRVRPVETTDLVTPRSSAILQVPPSADRQPSMSSQNANGVDMPMTPKNVGRRLLRTREALGLSQAEFCRQIGVERNLYNPFEKGRRRITIGVAMKIRDRYGITLDWIYAGEPHALPSDLYHKLVASAA
jgi:ribosome-binding protein aMBF1 (putative translation factor)